MKYLILTFAILITTIPNLSFAQNESTSTASSTESGGFFSNVVEGVNNLREGVTQQLQPEQNTALDVRTQERITNLAANISNRFDGIIARLQNIIDRLQKRIEKQTGLGYDVTAAKDSLDSAQASLNQAKDQMRDIDTAVTAALGSTDPRGEWKEVRFKYVIARDSIRIAHTELRNTIINLKVVSAPALTASSSTLIE